MPPTRTIPPAKAVKTERTHEENQERAYIAASRRSDRSLEARVESARRASEIHKRRTGRSLRVTEQDVINEEMYEEEDDDLPMQYRRLTAHLQTGSADFNRRLAAYLTNQVAMRSAMEQMVNNSYGQHQGYPNPMSQYPQQRPNMFQSPMLPQHQMTQSPTTSSRQAPYPSPHNAAFRQAHGRAYSTVVLPTKASSPGTPGAPTSADHRRLSTPASMHANGQYHIENEGIKPDPEYMRQTPSANMTQGGYPPLWQDMGPFTTQLPTESQQLLAGAPGFESHTPFAAMFMNGSENFTSSPYYPWNDIQQGVKGVPVHPSAHQGMSTTLAPSALERHQDSFAATSNTAAAPPPMNANAPSSGLDFDFSQDSKSLGLHPMNSMKREDSQQSLASGEVTPGESFWNNFVQDGGWSEEAATNA